MIGSKRQILAFSVGVVILGMGLLGSPFDLLLIPGALLVSIVFGLIFQQWRQKPRVPELGRKSSAAFQVQPPNPSQNSPPVSAPTGSEGPGLKPKAPLERRPKMQIPRAIIDHRVPFSLIGIGLPLIVGGLIAAGLPPSAALGYGLLIPGAVLFGVGSLMLFLQLYRRPVGLRRFCMNCGFQMLTTDFVCGRCNKQPPSGVDTRICPNCNAIIPAQAGFCRDCGAGQTKTA
jgi:hypothetical protein